MNQLTLIFSLASIGLALVTLLSEELRFIGILSLSVILLLIILYLQTQGTNERIAVAEKTNKKLAKKINDFEKQQDIYKKLYKLETKIESLKMRKGMTKIEWGMAAIAILLTLLVILGALGII